MKTSNFDEIVEFVRRTIVHHEPLKTAWNYMTLNYCDVKFPDSYPQELVRVTVTSLDHDIIDFYFFDLTSAQDFISHYSANHNALFWDKVLCRAYPAYNFSPLAYLLYGQRTLEYRAGESKDV